MEKESNKLSAVNWLINQLHKKQNGDFSDISYNQIFEQAKQMEKEQIEDAYFIGGRDSQINRYRGMHEYYEQTYGKTFIDLVSDEESQVHEMVRKLKEKKIK
jgi:hypothetical protein